MKLSYNCVLVAQVCSSIQYHGLGSAESHDGRTSTAHCSLYILDVCPER